VERDCHCRGHWVAQTPGATPRAWSYSAWQSFCAELLLDVYPQQGVEDGCAFPPARMEFSDNSPSGKAFDSLLSPLAERGG